MKILDPEMRDIFIYNNFLQKQDYEKNNTSNVHIYTNVLTMTYVFL